MKAGHCVSLKASEWIKLPPKSEFFMLPDRLPVGFNPDSGKPEVLDSDPYAENARKCFAVAAFIPPGYTLTHSTSYKEKQSAKLLPLFAYGACAFYKNDFYVAAIPIDSDDRHDERLMHPEQIQKGIKDLSLRFPKNRLLPHLANCATVNACANAKNFFLGRIEAPIPTSPVCNAQCQGCISLQAPDHSIPPTQKRIEFTPTADEIAELALFHIEQEADPIVSFGQGCEGEPSLSVDVIEKAVRLIRAKTSKGSLNMNTNASRPLAVQKLFDAGLNTIRVSLNSVREPYYSRYYQPRGYTLRDVTTSIDVAKKAGGFVSLNYLSMPGFTDSQEEFLALKSFIAEHNVDMIQWRNLNYDPLQYFRDLKLTVDESEMTGMKEVIEALQKEFPRLRMGYFNPKRVELRGHDT